MVRVLAVAVSLALLSAACGGSDDDVVALTLDKYTERANEIADAFAEGEEASEALNDFPIDGELAGAATLYTEYEAALTALRSITPPDIISVEHGAMVDSLALLQDVVGAYLEKASLSGDFQLEALNTDPEIDAHFKAFVAACADLATKVRANGGNDPPDVCTDG